MNKATRTVRVVGYGKVVSKAVTCVEILKRQSKPPLHQETEISYVSVEDIWRPKDDATLSPLKVKRNIPCIEITMTLGEES